MHDSKSADNTYVAIEDSHDAGPYIGRIVAFRTSMYSYGASAAPNIFNGAANSDGNDAFFGFVSNVGGGAPRLLVAIRPDGTHAVHTLECISLDRQARNPNNRGSRAANGFLEMRLATQEEIRALHTAIASGSVIIEYNDREFSNALAQAVSSVRLPMAPQAGPA